jgi:hypothetical protein
LLSRFFEPQIPFVVFVSSGFVQYILLCCQVLRTRDAPR